MDDLEKIIKRIRMSDKPDRADLEVLLESYQDMASILRHLRGFVLYSSKLRRTSAYLELKEAYSACILAYDKIHIRAKNRNSKRG